MSAIGRAGGAAVALVGDQWSDYTIVSNLGMVTQVGQRGLKLASARLKFTVA